jgi:hypothetical protein
MNFSHSLAVCGFAMRTNLRSAVSRIGIAGMLALVAVGVLGSWTAGRGLVADPNFLFLGYLSAALFTFRSGVEAQRETGLFTFLRCNFVAPVDHGVAMVLSLLGSWAAITALLMVVSVAFSGGDPALAAWNAVAFGLVAMPFLPFTLMVESATSFRLPLLVPVLGYLIAAALLVAVVGEARAVEIVRFDLDAADPLSLLRFGARAGLVLAGGMAVYLAAVALRGRRA